ncbi:hypothetical protein [Streptomyces sp. Qhu_M48]|uniref:hypothetical protein n=1 Tax=Streptomyces sp. Qhu_M48 TaxID=3435889 RepID=UPI003F4F5055
MSRRHHFHIDHLGHSVSTTVHTGHSWIVEILVDGKETGYAKSKGDGPLTVPIELPTDPPTPVSVRVTPGPGTPRCLLIATADGEPQVMAPRAY